MSSQQYVPRDHIEFQAHSPTVMRQAVDAIGMLTWHLRLSIGNLIQGIIPFISSKHL